MTLNIAVLGAGRIGKLHAENLAYRIPDARVTAIADINLAAAQETAARLNIPHAFADPNEALSRSDVDAVVIGSATDTHTPLIIASAQAGKHIFCEKPVDLSLANIDRALEAVDRAGVKLQIGFNRRFDPNFRRVRQAVVSGEIGTPHRMHIISRDPAPPPISYIRVSGGLFVDMMIHDFDMSRFLMGSEVTEVYTTAAVMVDPAIGEAGDVDTAVVVLTFENGVIGTIENSRRAVYGYDQRVEVFGSGGAVSTMNNYANNTIISSDRHVYRDLPLFFFVERYTESYAAELREFVDAVVNDKPVSVTGQDGRAPVAIALAARRSLEEHRPVRLSEITA